MNLGLRKGQKIPTGTRPCKLQYVQGWANADGVVHVVSETELRSLFPICNWTLNSTGGDLVGHNGEKVRHCIQRFSVSAVLS